MYLGTQVAARDDDDFRVFAQLGVKHISADPPGAPSSWTLEDLERHRDHVESFGLVLDMIQLPLPPSRSKTRPIPISCSEVRNATGRSMPSAG